MDEIQIPSALRAALDEAQSLTREQVAAAWQLQIEQVREQLESGWRERLDHIFEERFAEVLSRLETGYRTELEGRLSAAGSETIDRWNQSARRLRGAESREEWIRTLAEAAGPFCAKAAVFPITRKGLTIPGHPEIPLASAPAFQTAVESKDTVVAVGTAKELSEPVAGMFGDAQAKRVYLFPILARQNAVAVLCAEPGAEPVDVNALELLTGLAAASAKPVESTPVRMQGTDLIRIGGVPGGVPAGLVSGASAPAWTDLPRPEQEQHLRAQRFARTRVAELLLHRVGEVRAGREAHNLYGAFHEEIESGREAFRKDFIDTCPSMVDYFHLELEKTLAKGDTVALGAGYPGPLPVGASAGVR